MSKTAKGAIASVAVIAFAAATAFGSFALAQDGFGGPAADDQAAAQQNNDVTWDQQADGETSQTPVDAESGTANGSAAANGQTDANGGQSAQNGVNVNQQQSAQGNSDGAQSVQDSADADGGQSSDAGADGSAASNDAQQPTQDAAQQPAPVAVGDCANVQDWATLRDCVQNATADATVTITAPIQTSATDAGVITVTKHITITSTVDPAVNPTLTVAADDTTTGSIFQIANGGALTIGNDAGERFTYAGTADKAIARRFSTVDAGGSLTVNGGTFAYVKVDQGALALSNGGSVTVNGGTFQNFTVSNGGVVYARDGQIAINNGTFSNNTTDVAGVLSMYGAATATVAGGTFSKNVATKAGEWRGGGVIRMMDNSTLTITGGTFSENSTDGEGGGVIYGGGKAITIAGGSFEGNKSFGTGGGAIFTKTDGSTLAVVPADGQEVTFKNNGQTFADDVLKKCVANSSRDGSGVKDGCNAGKGGGAIAGFAGKVNIQGKVTFDGNYSNAWGFMLGGGAIYMKGELWVQNDAKGNKPRFVNNYAGVGQPEIVDGKVTMTLRGGAGGAIFLDEGNVNGTGADKTYTSKAYIMGGDFENNVSGYLGGAIYTESKSLTYVAKAVAYSNTAGHFGGGLWLCPSGTGEASKGGNIALFDNKVDKSIDPNKDNLNPATGGTGTEAGDDFAIMNPYHKGHENTSFQLMDTWFTDRTKSVVEWYHDGVPVKNASGYDDKYQSPNGSGSWLEAAGTSVSVTMTGNRHIDGDNSTGKIDGFSDNLKTLTLGQQPGAEFANTGVALKAQVLDVNNNGSIDDEKANAKQAAAVTMTGNAARLSGGAFATNGDVKFSTPYTASWTKVETSAAGLTDHEIAGAEWELTTTGDANGPNSSLGGPYSTDFYPGICPTSQDAEGKDVANGWADGTCWKETTNADGTTTRSLIIKDNMGSNAYVGVDNNPDGGGFDVNNLANGTYTLTERKAPTGYAPETEVDGTAKSYTFTVDNAQGIWQGGDGDKTASKRIGNKPLPGVSWAKTDTTLAAKDTVGGSEWKVTRVKDAQGNGVTNQIAYTVVDCADPVAESTDDVAPTANTQPCKDGTNDGTNHVYADTDGTSGKFTINPDADGIYKLEETKVPNNTYWHPVANTVYYFKIEAGNKDTKTVIYKSLDLTDEVENNAIANTSAQVAWSKVAGDDHTKLLGNSEWKISGPYVENGANGGVIAITATDVPINPCTSQTGANNPCEGIGHMNTVDSATGKVTEYADADPVEGKFLVRNLPAPQTGDGTTYVYKLTETKSPSGYVLPGVTYTFEIGYQQPTDNNGKVQIGPDGTVSKNLQVVHPTDAAGKPTGENLIPNVKVVSALPFTGGRAARDWVIVGGVLALGAGLAYAVVNWYRNRKGLGL